MIAKYDAGEIEFAALRADLDAACRDSITRMEATGSFRKIRARVEDAGGGRGAGIRGPGRLTPCSASFGVVLDGFPRAVVGARGNARPAPQRRLASAWAGLSVVAKSWVQYGTPRPLYATATPTFSGSSCATTHSAAMPFGRRRHPNG
jgi:hypothetical protein